MRKTISILLAVLMLASLGSTALAAEPGEYPAIGITMADPEAMKDCQGTVVTAPYGPIAFGPEVYYMPIFYFAMPEDEYNEFLTRDSGELTEEEILYIQRSQTALGEILVTNGTIEEMCAALGFEGDPNAVGLTEFGKADGFTFYYVMSDVEDYREAIGDEFAEDYVKVQEILKDQLGKATLYAPVDANAEQVGQVIHFETADLDGNAVTSEELFAGNEITMINYWGTWCHACVGEMKELSEIHTRLQKKGCGIVGILEDGDTDEKLALARQIMEENGTNYPNVLPSDDMTFLADVSSFPTSFFVDKEGRILCYPLSGAALDEYEATVDRLLEGETVSGITMPDAGANNEGVYRVIVKDRQGDMIQGVTIQFCDDTTCNIGKTDADGVASFDLPEGTEYIVHVLKVPEGYEKDSGEYHTLNVYSDVVIVLGAA